MTRPAFQTLQLERDGGVSWLRLNRPACLNALSEESFAELAAVLRAVGTDGQSRVLVLTGRGRGFCAGSDVEGLHARLDWSTLRQLERFERLGREVVQGLHGLGVPTIAAINGATTGGGLSLALACDIRVASDEATFGFGYTGMGLIPDLGATYFLPRVIGMSRACYLLWTNSLITASEASAIGLVDEVVPAGEFAAHVAGVAARIASAPQLAVRLGRDALRAASHGSLADALAGETVAQAVCLKSADHRDRVRAFLQQRMSAGNQSTMRVE